MSAVITPFEGTELFNTASFNDRISQINTGFSYVSNPNLLDNWYFGRPVNQRGQTEYNISNYAIDRWRLQNSTSLNVVDGGVNIIGRWDIEQFFEKALPNGTYTLSLLYKDKTGPDPLCLIAGNRSSGDVAQSSTKDASGIICVTFTSGNCDKIVAGFAGSMDNVATFVAIKLELGDTQTLAHKENGVWVLNEIPDFGEQLRRCQRYALALSKQSGHSVYGSGMINAGKNARIVVPLPVTMRTKPTVSVTGDLEIIANGTTYAVTSVSVESLSPTAVCLLVNSASLSTTQAATPALLRSYGGGKGELFLSADL